jgi:hypothetical protein
MSHGVMWELTRTEEESMATSITHDMRWVGEGFDSGDGGEGEFLGGPERMGGGY